MDPYETRPTFRHLLLTGVSRYNNDFTKTLQEYLF